jgi:hypothetical protein
VARWPGLFIVGAAHAGTAALGTYLGRHPDIFMAAPPETHYFSAVRPGPRDTLFHPVVSERDAYLALFSTARPEQLWAETSSSYLWSAEAPARIHAADPDARIVVMLRDPVERAWAHYWHAVREGFERRSFLRTVREEMERPGTWGVDAVYIGAGFYADAVAQYLEMFGRERVDVLFFETFRAHPRGAVHDLLAWLGLDPTPADHLELIPDDDVGRPRGRLMRRALGMPRLRRSERRWLAGGLHAQLRGLLLTDTDDPGMDRPVETLLRDLYAPDVERLTELLGIIPPWR